MKKFAMLLLCVALVFSCTIIAFADPDPVQYSITVDPAFEGETYNAYKIFDVTYSTPAGANDPVYTYTTSASSEWWTVVTTPADATDTTSFSGNPATDDVFTVDGLTFTKTSQLDGSNNPIYLVTLTNGDSLDNETKAAVAKTLADKFYANVAGKTAANAQPVVASGDTATINVASDGYYFVTTSLGALCALDTTNTTVTVGDKNAVPTIQKNVDASTDHSSGTWQDTTSACIGQPVDFQIIVTDVHDTAKALTLTDTMPEFSTLVSGSGNAGNFRISIVRYNNGGTATTESVTLANNDDVTLTVDANGRDFTIEFSADFMEDLDTNDQIVILYTGKLISNAYVSGNTRGINDAEAYNDNTVVMTYSNQTDEDTARVYTYEFEMVKVDDDDNVLTGAEFALYDGAGNNANQIYLTKDTTLSTATMNVYVVDPTATAQTTATIEAGLVRFVGLGAGSYYLEETQAPANYNALTARERMDVSAQNGRVTLTQDSSKWVQGYKVVNHSGSILPSTGGIGTYLFYGIGAILVVGAVVVLVSKKRMHAYSD